ncbi:MAG TPA: hypothetical protein EYQ60_17975 [Myxococcales bacterium]|nr:hypothetical protein [Myxococcales bacterium]HIK85240.1 hypothetical protein [Myxococcales bacterium]
MRPPILLILPVLLMAVACGQDNSAPDSDLASQTSSAQGIITGFGSIFVNGVEWEVDLATIEMDEAAALESALEIGMVVTISGELSDDGTTGNATSVNYDDAAEGPVAAITEIGNDGRMLELDVFGQTILVERGLTVFDEDNPSFNFDTLAVDDVIEISGFMNDLGVLIATHIEDKGVLRLGSTEVEIKGIVTNFDSVDTFEIDAMTITFDASGTNTDLSDIPGGLSDGLYVEVEGVIETGSAITATEIEIETSGFDDDASDVELEGIVANFVDIGDFSVSNQPVDASSAALVPNSPEALVNGAKVEIHGSMLDGTLIADIVEFRGNHFRLAAEIEDGMDVDDLSGSLTLLGVSVSVNAGTRYDDRLLDLNTFGLADLAAGDFLEIRGYADGNGGMVATRLERMSEAEEVSVQGFIEAFDQGAGSVTILGLTLLTSGSTSWEDADDMALTAEDFYAAVALGDLVKVDGDKDAADKTVMGIADEVEFED